MSCCDDSFEHDTPRSGKGRGWVNQALILDSSAEISISCFFGRSDQVTLSNVDSAALLGCSCLDTNTPLSSSFSSSFSPTPLPHSHCETRTTLSQHTTNKLAIDSRPQQSPSAERVISSVGNTLLFTILLFSKAGSSLRRSNSALTADHLGSLILWARNPLHRFPRPTTHHSCRH